MVSKKLALMLSFMIVLAGAVFVLGDSATSKPSVCCEKTKDGAYCINTDEGNCNDDYRKSPTSCETTAYCRLGTCYDSKEGLCMGNTPQKVCSDNGGTWDPRPVEEVPQCQLGCCIIADQAAFVPLVRCKKLSTFFGVKINYRTDIKSEVDCIATAQAQDMGACVYEKDFERTCKFTTRADCGADNSVESINNSNENSGRKFYKDFLCSAEELNTDCARQVSTTCYKGDVYWVDSCGNKENVYSSDRDKSWNNGRVLSPDKVCGPNDGSNKNCGNCDYLLGTRCADWEGFIGKPSGSDKYCKKTECVDRNGKRRKNGEAWCVYDSDVGEGKDKVGSRHFKEVCVDGEVRVEPCADFRNEICIESSIKTKNGEFGTAGCRVNRWQDCVLQDNKKDCLNNDKRDCLWVDPVIGMLLGSTSAERDTVKFSNPTFSESGGNNFKNPTATGFSIFGSDSGTETEKTETNRPDGICVPSFPPGLKFWEEGSAQSICGMASAKCVVVYEKGLLDSKWKVKSGGECLKDDWALKANNVCTSLGDCGGYFNYKGEYSDDGYELKVDGKRKEEGINPSSVAGSKGGISGLIVGSFKR